MSVDGHMEYRVLSHALPALEPQYGNRSELVFLLRSYEYRLAAAQWAIEDQAAEIRALRKLLNERAAAIPLGPTGG